MRRRTSEELFRRFQQSGDSSALARALADTGKRLRGTALRLAGNVHDAADLLQSTFLSVITSAERFDAEGDLRAWMTGILVNHARRLQQQAAKVPDAARIAKDPDGDPLVGLGEAEWHRQIQQAIDGLPQPYREVVRLHLNEDLVPRVIAQRLRRPSSTVRSQLQRGLSMLRRTLPPLAFLLLASELCTVAGHVRHVPGSGPGPRRPRVRAARIGAATAAAALLGAAAYLVFNGAPAGEPAGPAVPPASPAGAVAESAAGAAAGAETARQTVRPSSEGAATAGFRLRWRESGAPAANLPVRLYCAIEPGTTVLRTFHQSFHEAVTDENGEVVFEDVPPGRARLLLDDGYAAASEIVLAPGERRHVAVDVTPTLTVRGIVGDGEQAVPHAELWLSSTGGAATPGYLAGRSDAEGRYVVHAFGPRNGNWLSARAPGYADSPALRLDWPGRVYETSIGLRCDPGTFECVVLGLADEPLAGAVVGLAHSGHPKGRLAMPVYRATNDDGRVRFEGLAEGQYAVAAAHPAGAPAWRLVEVDAGGATEAVLRLDRGGELRGRVTDLGSPEDLRVVVYPDPGEEFSGSVYLLQAGALIHADGSFELDRLPAGPAKVSLRDARLRRVVASRKIVRIEAGCSTRLDLFPGAEHAVAGRVLRAGGSPAAGARITCQPVDFHDERSTPLTITVDPDGAFLFTGLPPIDHRLLVEVPGSSLPVAMADPVRPGSALADLIVDPPAATAVVRGSVVDANGTPRARVDVGLFSVASALGVPTATDDQGHFELRGIPFGDYWVRAQLGKASGVVNRVRVGTTELDAGELIVPDPLFREFRLAGFTDCYTPMVLRTEDGFEVRSKHYWGELPVRWGLLPGDYVIRYLDADLAWRERPLHVMPGGEESVELRLREGKRCELRFPYERPTGATVGPLRVEIRSSARTESFLVPLVDYGSYSLRLPLVPGRYAGRARTYWGTTTGFTFEVDRDKDRTVMSQRL